MKASDYIVEFLIANEVSHVFGYPGGMVTHLMDSLAARSDDIAAHVMHHEQGAAFAACGYAQASGTIGVAYATSGPGATNLLTGVCDAWFDSIPVLFITGQVNSFETKQDSEIRQRGFQETDIVSMVKGVTKYSARITSPGRLRAELEAAFFHALSGRRGPVLLDICMDVFRSNIEPEMLVGYADSDEKWVTTPDWRLVKSAVLTAARPVILVGNGVKGTGCEAVLRRLLDRSGVPCVSSMLAVDVAGGMDSYFGFIGAYGFRAANFVIAKSDLVIALGARMDVRQVGARRESFAPSARIVRIDIDESELSYKVHADELGICADVSDAIPELEAAFAMRGGDFSEWLSACRQIREKLEGIDDRTPNLIMRALGDALPDGATVVTDVGQNQVWAAQSLKFERGLRSHTSGGHGAMGYSLPAAIGCSLANGGDVVCSINGDGGFQMNMQELQTVVREGLPVKIIVFNNSALGMIRHFQEMYFESRYAQTVKEGGYSVPDLEAVARAYGVDYALVLTEEDITTGILSGQHPQLIEVRLDEDTYVFPKLEYGKPNQDQEPLIDRSLYDQLMSL